MPGGHEARLLRGKPVAAGIRASVAAAAERLRGQGTVPTLALAVATADESARRYVRALTGAAGKAGLAVRLADLGPDATARQLAAQLAELAADPGVHGIILQTPLPAGVRADELTPLIPPGKDVDGASPLSAGRLLAGLPAFAPATAAAVLTLLDAYEVPLEGSHAVVVGRSMVVGKPAAHLLLARNATVTICHSRTRDLPAVTRQGDVLVAAIGRPRFLGAAHVRPGAVVVDVGTTPDASGTLTGDVDAGAAGAVAGALTPVPGGVGPVTTATLLQHTVTAAGQGSTAPAKSGSR
ncbi:MAG: bifunctional 5,10-methylenetetrahydrofolate dehydrogenase/5,10-methenyltetrahydrofolate cyclohydrolase [Gemmatimonadota bacterium]